MVFFTRLGAYSATSSPACAAASRATPRAWPSFSVATASLLTKVASAAASCGANCAITRASPAWIVARRAAKACRSSVSTRPQPRKASRLPEISTIPQPVRRRPGSMPRMRIARAPTRFDTAGPAARLARGAPICTGGVSDRHPEGAREASLEGRPALELRPHLGHQRVGDLEIGKNVLHVVAVLQRLDQAQQLFALLVVEPDRALRLPHQGGLARLAEPRLQRAGDLAQPILLDRSE